MMKTGGSTGPQVGQLPPAGILDDPAGIGVERVGDGPLDLGHVVLAEPVGLPQVDLQALLRGEPQSAFRLGTPSGKDDPFNVNIRSSGSRISPVSHLKGFTPEWVSKWIFKLDFVWKSFPHWSQMQVPEAPCPWISPKCRRRAALVVNTAGQALHGW